MHLHVFARVYMLLNAFSMQLSNSQDLVVGLVKYQLLSNLNKCADLFSMLKMEELYLKTIGNISVVLSGKSKEFKIDLEKFFGRNSRLIHPNCRLLDINTNGGGVPEKISFNLLNTENVSFHINIAEKNQALTKRRRDTYAYNGPVPKIENLESETLTIGLKIKQSYYSDKDKSKNCINYPNTKFKSFKDCDENFITDEMEKLNVMPYWATDDQTKITRSMYTYDHKGSLQKKDKKVKFF